MRPIKSLTAAILLSSLATYAQAEDTAPFPKWTSSAELGMMMTSGNTDTTSVNAKFELMRTGEIWTSRFRATALNSEDNDVSSKEKYTADYMLNRNFNERSYMTFNVDQVRDRFSGFIFQTTAFLGYGYRVINTDTVKLAFEAGPGYRHDRERETDEDNKEAIGRLAMNYAWDIAPNVKFIEEFTADLGSNNNIYRSETGLQSQINGSLATKITYKITHVDEVPVDTERTDTEFGVTLVYSFK